MRSIRVKVYFEVKDKLKIPVQYNYYVQSMIYNILDDEYSDFLHDEGYIYGQRKYKLFTFSRLFGKYRLDKKNGDIAFLSPISIYVSAAKEEFLHSLINALIKKRKAKLKGNILYFDTFKVFNDEINYENNLLIKMLSPITVYSTFQGPAGKKTYYYHPDEKEFELLINENLIKKSELINGLSSGNNNISIKPISNNKMRVIKYKGFVIKAWDGIYELSGSPELKKISYQTGLGAKNSMGFGMWELFKERG